MASQWIKHKFSGGWATDYGNTFMSAQDNGYLQIPWCQNLENIRFNIDGSVGKFPGTFQVNNYPLFDRNSTIGINDCYIHNTYDYWRMGTSLTGTRQVIVAAGFGYYAVSPGSTTYMGDSNSQFSPTHFSTFNDLLIIGRSGGKPKSWDQTTFQDLAGSPPNFGFSTLHAGRHWAAGNPSVPYRLYYSVVGSPEDWTGSGSGSIDIDPGDGDGIVALLSWKSQLWVFKGPNKLSIHIISGADPTTFVRTPFVYGISAAGPNSIFPIGDDFAFWTPKGTCHSMTVTNAYGNYSQSFINYPILSWCRNQANMNSAFSSFWQAVSAPLRGISIIVFNNSYISRSTPYSTFAIMMDWRFIAQGEQYPRFYKLTLDRFSSVSAIVDYFSGGIDTQFLFGTPDGNIHQEARDSATTFIHKQLPYPSIIDTPYLGYGSTHNTKTLNALSVDFDSSNNSSVTVTWAGSRTPLQSTSFTQPGFVGLDSFALDADVLGDLEDTSTFYEPASGEYRAIRYTITENTNNGQFQFGSEAAVNSLDALITVNGVSMENVR